MGKKKKKKVDGRALRRVYEPGMKFGGMTLLRRLPRGFFKVQCKCGTLGKRFPGELAARFRLGQPVTCRRCMVARTWVEPECKWCGVTDSNLFGASKAQCMACDRARCRYGVCQKCRCIRRGKSTIGLAPRGRRCQCRTHASVA